MAEETCKSEIFTLDDRILALSIYKQSGKAYRLLAKVFSLPSRQTIMKLLQKIPFSPGLNQQLFDNLKHSVSKLPKSDRYCCLLFDEMAIQPSLHYSSNNDKIIG
ncbi:hypothetical protein PR048_002798 [Dryococelus australis]|uniref:Transposable element P transposase-like RNase H domain-containing protein n=1 Tax=Dryococelus australis TaxID=614101 RepID=A0ABQ9IL98_9NEOP|nr:hypothetical protein PR048_002798 [Dryococelus australis]